MKHPETRSQSNVLSNKKQNSKGKIEKEKKKSATTTRVQGYLRYYEHYPHGRGGKNRKQKQPLQQFIIQFPYTT